MKKTIRIILTALALNLFLGTGLALATGTANPQTCSYYLTPAPGQPGTAKVIVVGNVFVIVFRGVRPDALYTLWTDHRNRATGDLADDYPIDQGALPRGVAPTFATIARVTSGMGLDRNGVVTDEFGNAIRFLILDYRLLEEGVSPVVGAQLAMQGLNRVGGGWLRIYENPHVDVAASLQRTNPSTGLPLVERSTAQGITIVVHPDRVTHGHTPGVGGVDHFPAFSGDFPDDCLVKKDA